MIYRTKCRVNIGLDVSTYVVVSVGLNIIGVDDADLDVDMCAVSCCRCCYCGLDFGIECSYITVMVQLLQ